MSHLTIETMDKINFLITEVSLECLGNKFFDVYGNQAESLLRLISAGTLKPGTTDKDDETELWKSLTAPKKRARVTFGTKVSDEPQRKRRASFSNTNNEAEVSNDPESLLVPMAPKAAKISNRRSTISVQLAKQTRKQAISSQLLRNQKQIGEVIQLSDTSPPKTRRQSLAATQTSTNKIPEIQQHLRRDTDSRKFLLSMKMFSNKQQSVSFVLH